LPSCSASIRLVFWASAALRIFPFSPSASANRAWVRGFGPLLVAMDAQGASLYSEVGAAARHARAEVLASLGVKSERAQHRD
jgi:hypothetical protein